MRLLSIPFVKQTAEYYDEGVWNNSGVPNQSCKASSNFVDYEHIKSGPCFAMFPVSAESEEIRRVSAFYTQQGKKLVTEPISAFVVYDSLHDQKEIRSQFPVVAVFIRSKRPECSGARCR